MATAYRILLESKEAFAAIGSGAGHLYLVLRKVDVDSNGIIESNSYNFVSDRTIGGNSSAVSQRLTTAEMLLIDRVTVTVHLTLGAARRLRSGSTVGASSEKREQYPAGTRIEMILPRVAPLEQAAE